MSDQSGPDGKAIAAGNETESAPAGDFSDSLKERLTAAWEKREPKWYERLAPAQKHWVDRLVAIRLDEFEAHLTALDREDSQLAHQMAELTARLVQLNKRLAGVEKRLASVEDRLEGLESGQATGPQE